MLIHQRDATAFLNGKLDKEIYMEQPHCYVISEKENLVLHGLKHAVTSVLVLCIQRVSGGADLCVYVRNHDCHCSIRG